MADKDDFEIEIGDVDNTPQDTTKSDIGDEDPDDDDNNPQPPQPPQPPIPPDDQDPDGDDEDPDGDDEDPDGDDEDPDGDDEDPKDDEDPDQDPDDDEDPDQDPDDDDDNPPPPPPEDELLGLDCMSIQRGNLGEKFVVEELYDTLNITEEVYNNGKELFDLKRIYIGDIIKVYNCRSYDTDETQLITRIDLVVVGDTIYYQNMGETELLIGAVENLLYDEKNLVLKSDKPNSVKIINALQVVRSISDTPDTIFISVSTQIVRGILNEFNSKLCKLNRDWEYPYNENKILFCLLGRSICTAMDILRKIDNKSLFDIREELKDGNISLDSLIAFDAEIAKSVIRKTTYYPEYFDPYTFFDTIVYDCFEKLCIFSNKNTYLLSSLDLPNTPNIAVNKSYDTAKMEYLLEWVGIEKWVGLLKFHHNNKLHTFDLWIQNMHNTDKIGIPLAFLYDLSHSVERYNVDSKFVVNPTLNSSIGYTYFNQLQILLNGI
jgi:hypothetical protein